MQLFFVVVMLFSSLASYAQEAAPSATVQPAKEKKIIQAVRVKGDVEKFVEKTSPFSLFFAPKDNKIRLDQQKIDFDITKETVLRLGPFLLDQSSVSMQITREQGEFYELDFGFELTRRLGAIYVVSFNWPSDYIRSGVIEIINDKSESIWRRRVNDKQLQGWQDTIKEQNNRALFDRRRDEMQSNITEKSKKESLEEIRKNLNLARPQNLSPIHHRAQWGLAHRSFYEFPITQMTEPFRFCLSEDDKNSRLAICSKRYVFQRTAGRYVLKDVSKDVRPKIQVNEKPVTTKGTAIFLENNVPIKFAAMLKNGTYFEFVSNPKEIQIVDMVLDEENKRFNVIGFGDTPMGQIDESFYADSVHWGFLNFMPTIGDLRKYWRAGAATNTPYLYLRGEGGAPFRQTFLFDSLPTRQARVTLSEKTTRSTYSSKVWVKGQVNPEIQVGAADTEVNRLGPEEFEWHFLAPQSGQYNRGLLDVTENDKTWKAGYEIYRGFPAEIGLRSDLLITNEFQVLILGELGFQYWFESILGWENYTLSKQRWGVAARYSETVLSTGGEGAAKGVEFAFGNVDIKYRFTPGIWGRDPTVGMIFSAHSFHYFLPQIIDEQVIYGGGGVFWARSMPRVFDEIFNIVPFLRYPKWVDWEFLAYPVPLSKDQEASPNFVMNFHGKIQWTPRVYGEGGFGIKSFRVRDLEFNKAATPYIAYGKLGIGINF